LRLVKSRIEDAGLDVGDVYTSSEAEPDEEGDEMPF
jgi:hypothetical protein